MPQRPAPVQGARVPPSPPGVAAGVPAAWPTISSDAAGRQGWSAGCGNQQFHAPQPASAARAPLQPCGLKRPYAVVTAASPPGGKRPCLQMPSPPRLRHLTMKVPAAPLPTSAAAGPSVTAAPCAVAPAAQGPSPPRDPWPPLPPTNSGLLHGQQTPWMPLFAVSTEPVFLAAALSNQVLRK